MDAPGWLRHFFVRDAEPPEMTEPTAEITVDTPIGPVAVRERDGAIVRTRIGARAQREDETALLATAAQQLNAFFYCDLKRFDLPLAPEGTKFELAVWEQMRAIPFGQTRTYGEVARTVGGEARDVGQACGANRIPILIPCHRVVAGGGKLGGFSAPGGVETKRALLVLEGAMLL
jgi:methylated-DNA-[protein]-cysteine S-methyltransferase